MGELIFLIILGVPAIYGISELIHLVKAYVISPKGFTPKYLIVFLGENSPYEQLVAAAEELFWHGKKYAQNIIAVDCGIKQEEYYNCRELCEKNNFIFCSATDLSGYLDVLMGKI